MRNNILEFKVRSSTVTRGCTRKLNTIFQNFYSIIDEYCSMEEGQDAPYWYNERATLSIFSGAIWRSGEIALEEFSIKKIDDKTKTEKPGRADLWFSCSDVSFICEAKQYARHPNTNIKTIMEPARKDVKRTGKSFPDIAHLALTFWIPFIKENEVDDSLDNIHSALTGAMKEGEIDMYCLASPSSARNIREFEDSALFPCVVLLGKFEFLPEDSKA